MELNFAKLDELRKELDRPQKIRRPPCGGYPYFVTSRWVQHPKGKIRCRVIVYLYSTRRDMQIRLNQKKDVGGLCSYNEDRKIIEVHLVHGVSLNIVVHELYHAVTAMKLGRMEEVRACVIGKLVESIYKWTQTVGDMK